MLPSLRQATLTAETAARAILRVRAWTLHPESSRVSEPETVGQVRGC